MMDIKKKGRHNVGHILIVVDDSIVVNDGREKEGVRAWARIR